MTTTDPVLREWIGAIARYEAPEALGEAAIRYFAFALEDPNPLYRDKEFARSTSYGGIIAPPTLICETNQFTGEEEDPEGYIGHYWDLPLNNGRFMRGSNDYEFFRPVRPTDKITVNWRILDIYERTTKKRGRLVFVKSEARYLNQHDELLAINREINIYTP
ncbi:MAG: MaoC family dehydratase N-terminal domain-containing protein [Proteobacteria bacterium]|nr:MaoC family dehydratase N-terminal domain-containing protein [Pseudomonadota bacterium]